MSELRLLRLPDRTPVKLTIALLPEVNDRLVQYAYLYRESYGCAESVADLVPAMLSAFMDSDRAFARRKVGS
ncbi:MAG TPA: DUF2274 domain-containing protein [Sphingomonas sp.]|uniref:DUF2274 domain-containing protein n=1 Tax=Sphingomonas sp. TaxID=28214 RepID=UPI002C51938E|nr:DUF2274 domain-containing protein [Sphingomonas sp.]HMI20104.1 DUF2274 domain-containing protein [Sphingomonas sp.]